MKKYTTLYLAGAGLALTGCNTIAGIGKDLQIAGAGVSNAAASTRESMSAENKASAERAPSLRTGPSHARTRPVQWSDCPDGYDADGYDEELLGGVAATSGTSCASYR